MPARARAGAAQVSVDFNELDDDGHFYALAEDSDRPLRPADLVVLHDGDGNRARGVVLKVTARGAAVIDMDPATWEAAGEISPLRHALVVAHAHVDGNWKVADLLQGMTWSATSGVGQLYYGAPGDAPATAPIEPLVDENEVLAS